MRVLVIEDHADLAENIGDFLELEGHSVDVALDGVVGLHLAVTEPYDVIVLDLMLPGIDGLSLCRRLQAELPRRVPILMLTALDSLSDKLQGFESGASDYLTKPFALEELAARLNALHSSTRERSDAGTLRYADVELDRTRFEARRDGRRLELKRTAFRILEELVLAAPGVIERSALERAIWGDEPPDSDSLRTHIYTLRRVLDRPFDRALLHTVHGVGYRLLDANEEDP
jgi:DNA-binding response OmpR family regulator